MRHDVAGQAEVEALTAAFNSRWGTDAVHRLLAETAVADGWTRRPSRAELAAVAEGFIDEGVRLMTERGIEMRRSDVGRLLDRFLDVLGGDRAS